ncbi:hypothetical protein SSAG_06603 [Streptomyces sp. Mg1]|nr:hypothetical protein SSAG_06603 [Streptomyces sp. Mg1]
MRGHGTASSCWSAWWMPAGFRPAGGTPRRAVGGGKSGDSSQGGRSARTVLPPAPSPGEYLRGRAPYGSYPGVSDLRQSH